MGKIILRFIVLPILATISSGIQMYFLKSAPQKHTEYVIPGIWISNGFTKIFERLLTNTMFNSGDYVNFAASTFVAAVVEMVNHATYFTRISATHRVVKGLSNARRLLMRRMINLTDLQETNIRNDIPRIKDDDAWMQNVRKKLIIEDVTIELMMVFTVTFLLYFVHTAVRDERFETIPSIRTCLVQLFIQIVFELMSDIFGLYWTVSRHKIPLQMKDVDLKDQWYWVWLVFIFWQTFELIYWLLLD